MKSLVQKLLLVSLAVAIAIPLAAQDKEKGKKKGAGGGPVAQIKKAISELDLTAEQKTKIADVVANYTTKLADAQKAAGDAPRKVADAKKKLKDDGKKNKEINNEYKAVAKLSDEEEKAYDKLEALTREFRAAVAAVLTDEQKDKAGFGKGKKKKAA